jgi:hypothetical protein
MGDIFGPRKLLRLRSVPSALVGGLVTNSTSLLRLERLPLIISQYCKFGAAVGKVRHKELFLFAIATVLVVSELVFFVKIASIISMVVLKRLGFFSSKLEAL